MNFIWDKITEWLKGLLVGGIVSNLSGLFDSINTRVADVASTVGKTPQAWNGSIFSMIKSLSENVVVPIAGIILTFVMCLELIQLLIDRNNMHDFETFIFFKWIFKTFAAVLIVTNTWNIVMGVFDVAQHVVSQAAGVIIGETAIVGDNVTLYQGVTLGGTGKEKGKRHPTLKDNVMVSAGAKILGSFTIGENSKIGAGSVVLEEVPPNCTVVGVPGRIVKMGDQKVPRSDMDQVHLPDPVLNDIRALQNDNLRLLRKVQELEKIVKTSDTVGFDTEELKAEKKEEKES